MSADAHRSHAKPGNMHQEEMPQAPDKTPAIGARMAWRWSHRWHARRGWWRWPQEGQLLRQQVGPRWQNLRLTDFFEPVSDEAHAPDRTAPGTASPSLSAVICHALLNHDTKSGGLKPLKTEVPVLREERECEAHHPLLSKIATPPTLPSHSDLPFPIRGGSVAPEPAANARWGSVESSLHISQLLLQICLQC